MRAWRETGNRRLGAGGDQGCMRKARRSARSASERPASMPSGMSERAGRSRAAMSAREKEDSVPPGRRREMPEGSSRRRMPEDSEPLWSRTVVVANCPATSRDGSRMATRRVGAPLEEKEERSGPMGKPAGPSRWQRAQRARNVARPLAGLPGRARAGWRRAISAVRSGGGGGYVPRL